jgi:hypothetical protein
LGFNTPPLAAGENQQHLQKLVVIVVALLPDTGERYLSTALFDSVERLIQ